MKINKKSWHFKWLFKKTETEHLPTNICKYLFLQLSSIASILFVVGYLIPSFGLSVLGIGIFIEFSYNFLFKIIDNY